MAYSIEMKKLKNPEADKLVSDVSLLSLFFILSFQSVFMNRLFLICFLKCYNNREL